MRILGLVFAGTATVQRAAMARFAQETLGLERVAVGGVEADMFALPDGSHFAVADPRGMGETSRSIGEPAENDRHRYVHFRAPDGKLYELVEER